MPISGDCEVAADPGGRREPQPEIDTEMAAPGLNYGAQLAPGQP